MKLLFDFLPIVLFFVAFKVWDIYIATAVAMIATALQLLVSWFITRKIEGMYLFTLAIITVLGGATIYLQDEFYIKWKPTAVNWLFSALFLGSQYVGHSPIIKRMMGEHITLPERIWSRLNFAWSGFFFFLGLINIYVIYNFNTDTWVYFKVIGNFGLVFIFIILQAFYMSSFILENDTKK